MIAVDTNVLVRVLVDDPGHPAQVKRARERLRHAKQVYVPQIVQAETVWVLESAYGLGKPAIAEVLEHLARNKAFVLQAEASFQEALTAYRGGSADFSDYLIAAESASADCALVTFDKHLGKTKGVELMEA